MNNNYKFKLTEGIIEVFRDGYSFYWFSQEDLIRNLDESNIILHLCNKMWFTEPLFFQLITISKKIYPEFNFDKIIFEAGKIFHLMSLYDNPNEILRLHMLTQIGGKNG